MLTYRTGVAGSPSSGMAMAEHLLEVTVPPTHAVLAAYYEHAVGDQGALELDAFEQTIARVRPDLDPAFGRLLGLHASLTPTAQEIANILAGLRADGKPIPGKQRQGEARSLAIELGLDVTRAPSESEVDRIFAGVRADTGEQIPHDRTKILRSRFLALFGVDEARGHLEIPSALANIRAGRRGDGGALRIAQYLDAITATRARIGFVDCTFAADKSVSLAWAMATTEGERACILNAHRTAVASAMQEIERDLGKARKGKGGRSGFDQGHIGWISFEHFTARPTVEIASTDPVTGEAYTKIVTLRVAGDPHLHTHVAVPHCVLVDANVAGAPSRVGSLDLSRLEGRVHELGGLYQAHLATNLRALGISVTLDGVTGSARVQAIPEYVRAAFSKRTTKGEAAAREYAAAAGLDWEMLDGARRIGLLKQGTQGDPRAAKRDDLGDFAHWRAQAVALDWRPGCFTNFDAPAEQLEKSVRLSKAYEAALPILEKNLRGTAVLDEAVLRVAAVRGLVASGIESASDVDGVVALFTAHGAIQDGEHTELFVNLRRDRFGREKNRFTSALHVDREKRVIHLVREAGADKSAALTTLEIEAAAAKSGLDFSNHHGRAQKSVMIALGISGKFGMAIGVAGSGKSTLMAPLVDCWRAQGRAVFGTAIAWRQAQDLASAGIHANHCLALAAFLARVRAGTLTVDSSTVVVLDEVGLASSKQFLELLELRASYKFSLIGLGDPLQAQSVDSGGVIDLVEGALGSESIPSLVKSVRQITAEERKLAGLFRDGRAREALDILRENGRAILAPGTYEDAVEATARLWHERMQASVADRKFSLLLMAPTNAEARAISKSIRARRRAAGELGEDQVRVDATDQTGTTFELTLAIGDRVRLFSRVNASGTGSRGLLGVNGSVTKIRAINADGLVLENSSGRAGLVRWETLRDTKSQRILLTYGDCATIDASQGVTATEAIFATPSGVAGIDSGRAYVAASRHRQQFFLVVGEAAVRRDITARRALGDIRPIGVGDIWETVAARFSSRKENGSAAEFMEMAHAARHDAVRLLQTGLAKIEVRKAANQTGAALFSTFRAKRFLPHVRRLASILDAWIGHVDMIVAHLNETRPWAKSLILWAKSLRKPTHAAKGSGPARRTPQR